MDEEDVFREAEGDDEEAGLAARDFDLEAFGEPEPYYDRTDPINGLRIIYTGETAAELERQEEYAHVYKHKDRGWLLRKNEAIVERVQHQRDMEGLYEVLAEDDWGFVETLDLDQDRELAPRPSSVYLDRDNMTQQDPVHATPTPEDFLKKPGLELQEMPSPVRHLDVLGAFKVHKDVELHEMEEEVVETVALTNDISESDIQRLLPAATIQGVGEESLRAFARSLSDNRYLTLSEKLRRLRVLAGYHQPGPAYWKPRVQAIINDVGSE